MIKYKVMLVVFLLATCFTLSKDINKDKKLNDFPVLKGPYLGQKPPGMTPEIFASGIVSTKAYEFGAVFSKDGKEFYFAVGGAPFEVIFSMKHMNGRWTEPETLSFAGRYSDYDMNMSPDGKRIFFTSRRPVSETGKSSENDDLWYAERTENGWAKPVNLGYPVNTDGNENYPSVTKNGTVYFHRHEKDGKKDLDIFYAEFFDGKYKEPIRLGPEINSDKHELDPFIAPDGSYLIYGSSGRKNSLGRCDLYISFKRNDGSWTKAINMGKEINSNGNEYTPSVSPDGKYLFFMSSRTAYKQYSEIQISYDKKIEILNNPENGNGDIYWVSTQIIDDLKKQSLNK